MLTYGLVRLIAGTHHAASAARNVGPAMFVVDAIAGHLILKLINAPVLAPTLKAASLITGHDLTGWEY